MNLGFGIAVELVVALGLSVVPVVLAYRARKQGAAQWAALAERRGLSRLDTGLLTTFEGTVDGLRVQLSVGQVEAGRAREAGTYLELSGPISPALELDAGGLDFGALFSAEKLEPGNHDEAWAAAALDARTRRRVNELAKRLQARVTNGTVGLTPRPRGTADAERIFDEALELGRLLAVPQRDVPARLLGNAQQEPLPEARLHNHKLLLLCHPRSEEAAKALELARHTADPELKLLRAELLPERPFETARTLALAAELGTSVRLKALDLAVRTGDPRLSELLARLVAEPAGTLSRAAMRRVRREHAAQVLGALGARARAADLPTARALLDALIELGDSAAEPALLELLRRHESALRDELVEALGQLGGLRAVEPLLALEASGVAQARGAITRIQSRMGEVEAGRLSVVHDTGAEGGLSLAGPDEGALSLADDAGPRR